MGVTQKSWPGFRVAAPSSETQLVLEAEDP